MLQSEEIRVLTDDLMFAHRRLPALEVQGANGSMIGGRAAQRIECRLSRTRTVVKRALEE